MGKRRFGGYLPLRLIGVLAAIGLVIGATTLGTGLGLAGVVTGANTEAFVYVYPRYILPPRISGRPIEGETLTVKHGLYLHRPTSFSEQWLRCKGTNGACAAIAHATGDTYMLTIADVGDQIRVQETAHNSYGSSSPVQSRPTSTIREF